jgi:hypothetical protein
MKKYLLLLSLMVLLAITACGGGQTEAPTPTIVEPLSTPSLTAEPTQPPTQTLEPSPTPEVLTSPFSLVKVVDQVQAYPGPRHYAGDVLTFEVPIEGYREPPDVTVTLSLDGEAAVQVPGQWSFNKLLVPLALDTSGMSGAHEVRIQVVEDSTVDAVYQFDVLPSEALPENEIDAQWEILNISCCTLHYITNSAADRDLESIADHAQAAAEDFARVTGIEVLDRLDVYIVDRMWGNGAFGGGGELLVSYTDRYYGPTQDGTGLETLFRHEFTHAMSIDRTAEGFFPFNEGLAVLIAGGHFKPEPIPERGAAMLELGYEVGLDTFPPQHELAYLTGAVFWSYMEEAYGWDTMIEFGQSASGDRYFDPEERERIMQGILGVSSVLFEDNYLTWLSDHEPAMQLDDLRLTVAIQDLRRRYQREYAPEPFSIFGVSVETFGRAGYLPMLIRETNAPSNAAVELMIANTQKAIIAGDYASADALRESIQAVLDSGEFTTPLAHDYASITAVLSGQGYEGLSLELRGDEASVQVTRAAPSVEQVTLQRIDGEWQIIPGL